MDYLVYTFSNTVTACFRHVTGIRKMAKMVEVVQLLQKSVSKSINSV